MDKLYDNYAKSPKIQVIKGDFIDRLHGNLTISFLFVILTLMIIAQSFYSTIVCWNPTAFTDSQIGYLDQFCYINSTYHYPTELDPDKFTDDKRHPVPYYQFIIFIIVGQILMFRIPPFIWKILASNLDGYMNKLLDIVTSKPSDDNEKKKQKEEFVQTLRVIGKNRKRDLNGSNGTNSDTASLDNEKIKSNYADQSTESNLDNETKNKLNYSDEKPLPTINEEKDGLHYRITSNDSNKNFTFSKSISERNGKQRLVKTLNVIKGVEGLAFKYFLFKVFNLLNVILQIVFLNLIFGGEFIFYGLKYATKLWQAVNPLLLTKEFPIFTLCDFYVHQPNRKIHENRVQCVLPINVLLEKFYVLIWFWLAILVILTFWNLLSWSFEVFFSKAASFAYKYLSILSRMKENRKYIRRIHDENEENEGKLLLSLQSIDHEEAHKFQKDYLGRDGLVMLMIIKSIAGDVTFIELLNVLWKDYNDPENKIETKTNV